MSGSVNKAIIVGNLGRDPEVRTMQNGDKVVGFSVATSERWKDRQSGEKKERTEWHRASVFNQHLADVAEKYLRKGSKVYIEGQLQTRKWTDQQGQERFTTEIVLAKFRGELTMLSGRDEDAGTSRQDYGGGTGISRPQQPAASGDDLDDDIPF